MSFTPTEGPVAVLKFKPSGGGAAVTCPGINWKLSIDAHLKDCSNFKTGRFRKKTLADATLSFTLVWDNTAQPNDPAGFGLTDGAIVEAQCFTDATHFFDVPCAVSTVGPGVSGVEDVVMYDVECLLHNGSVTYPLIP